MLVLMFANPRQRKSPERCLWAGQFLYGEHFWPGSAYFCES